MKTRYYFAHGGSQTQLRGVTSQRTSDSHFCIILLYYCYNWTMLHTKH